MVRNPDWSRDELVLACVLVADGGWKSLADTDPRVIELSELLQRGPTPVGKRSPTFRNPNGVGRKTADIATAHPDYVGKPTNGGELDKVVLAEFLEDPARIRQEAAAIRGVFESGQLTGGAEAESDLDVGVVEGGVLLRSHARRERNKALRKRKLDSVEQSGRSLKCEVCGLEPGRLYSSVGSERSLLDVHHVLPLSVSGQTVTRLADLAVVCPSCHRAIHASQPWVTPAELRANLGAS